MATDFNSILQNAGILNNSAGSTRLDIISSTQSSSTSSTVSVAVGDFAADSRFLPFIREQKINLFGQGLRPNTRVYVFFDKKRVDNAYIRPASSPFPLTETSFYPIGNIGDALVSNADGTLYAILYLPPNTFFIGDREILITDIDDLASISASTTSCSSIFRAFNFATSTQTITNTITTTTENVIVATRPPEPPVPLPPPPLPPTINPNDFEPAINVETDILGPNRHDPISQTFFVSNNIAQNQDGIFLSKIDVFFQKKDANFGVTCEIRSVVNGFPSSIVLPFGRKHLSSSQVSISNNASVATSFEFDSPIFLKSGNEYCFVILPDGNSPDYLIWTSTTGGTDITTSRNIISNWGEGTMFLSTNGTAWTPYQNEDVKFKIYRANFTTASGTLNLINRDYEFFVANSISGTFMHGETVFQNTANLSGTVSLSTTSSTITGTNTSFTTAFAVGNYISLVGGGSNNDVLQIASIANNTSLIVNGRPKFSGNSNFQKSPVGRISFFDRHNGYVYLEGSTANSSVKFAANTNSLIGTISNANCQIEEIIDKKINYFQPLMYRTAVHGTSVQLFANCTTSSLTSVGDKPYEFSDTNYLTQNEIIIASKTNEINNLSGNKSLSVKLNLSSKSPLLSPMIDLQSTSFLAYQNIINNDSSNENKRNGLADAKYISKLVTLADGLDSEDIKVLLTAYKPTGTQIKVYAKILNSGDTENFDDKDWTLLDQLTNSALYSDNLNSYDYKEYEYSFPAIPPSSVLNGAIAVSANSATLTGSGTSFNSDIVGGDLLKINNAGSFQVVSVASVANSSSLTCDDIITFSNPATTFEKITYPKSAFKNPMNSNIVRYFSSSRSVFDGYKVYAIKIVLTATASNLVPKIKDMRAIALSI